MSRPLAGLRVLDFTHVLAGPFGTRILADLGADVVKINSQTRSVLVNEPDHPYYLMWNRNKRALALDMSKAEARSICRRLCEKADVVVDNFSVGVLDRWGVGYDEISEANPGVVYVQMSGMGEGGPWSKFVTYAPTIHALAGLTHLTGIPEREDIGIGFSYNDHQVGLHGAVAILAALEARRRTGRGQRVEVSQFEIGVGFLGPALLDFFTNGRAARPSGNRLPYDKAAPHGCYPCAGVRSEAVEDERWVAIACLTREQWEAFRGVMGDPKWAAEERYASVDGRLRHVEALDRQIATWTRGRTAEQVMEACQRAGVPAGVVQTGVDLAERDPQLARSRFCHPIEEPHPRAGQTWADRLPLRFHGTPCEVYRRSRELGEDNAEVLRDWLGLSEAHVRAAEDDGALG